jgi:Recombinase zinc beta ribbon domain
MRCWRTCDAIRLLGISLALLLLIWLALRGWSVPPLPRRGRGGEPLLAAHTQIFISSAARFRAQFFPLLLLGRRRSRRNEPERVIVEEAPESRIFSDKLWAAAKARQTAISESEGVTKARATRFWEQRRAQHLLSGLVYCGSCGSRLASVGRDYLACSAARGRGTCTNRKGIRRALLGELILDGLRQRLMASACEAGL